jgi:hypothetical protein
MPVNEHRELALLELVLEKMEQRLIRLRLAFVEQDHARQGTRRRVTGFRGGVRVLVGRHDGIQKTFRRFLWVSIC